MKDDLRYTPSDCFETFPFPENFETDPALESAGQAYYDFRAALMVRNNEGLTKTYNRFHDPDERSPDILKLRELHAAMDRAVLDAYGWTDLKPTCEFLLDYEEDEDEDESGGGRRRKKPWRYRWPDDFRDEVLARLLELNRQRAEQERLSGAAAEKSALRRRRGSPRVAPYPRTSRTFPVSIDLFVESEVIPCSIPTQTTTRERRNVSVERVAARTRSLTRITTSSAPRTTTGTVPSDAAWPAGSESVRRIPLNPTIRKPGRE